MDYYDDDFDEEIEESIGNTKETKQSNNLNKKNQPVQANSKKELQPINNYKSSMKEFDNRSRNGIRKTVNLSKTHTRRDDDDDDNDEDFKEPVKILQTKSKSTHRKRSPSYDDDIEEELNQGNAKSKSPIQKRKINDTRALDQEALRISKSYERRSVLSTPPKSHVYQVGYFEKFRDFFESDISGKEMKELEAENNRLRDSLKELNDQLTKIVERSRLSSLAPKKMEFKNKNVEDRLRTTLKEIENNQKILELTATEYTHLKTRLDQIKDPAYLLDLEDKINETNSKTEAANRANKGLRLANGNIGKDLDEIDKADGVAPMIQEANEKAKEVVVLKKKLSKLQEMNKGFEEEDAAKSTKYEKVQEQYRKIQAEAHRYNIKFEDEKLIVQYTNLKAQVKSLEDHLKMTSNKNEKYMKSQIERAIEELYITNMKEKENLDRLDDMIEEQKVVLREMVEQEEHKTDKNIREVISKIKASLDGDHLTVEPTFAVNNEITKAQVKSVNNLQSKQHTNNSKNKEKYSDLPVFDVSKGNVKIDSLLNKKDIIKKEINALKEKARIEDSGSRTPKAEKDNKTPFLQNKTNSKPNLREKRKDPTEGENKSQQAEQQKQKVSETTREIKDPENINIKPNFSKPNLFKKSDNGAQTETQINKSENNDSHGFTLNSNRSPTQNEFTIPGKNFTKKEEALRLPGQEKILTLDNRNTPHRNDNKIFLTHQEGYGSNKKEELSLPGTFNEQKKPSDLKRNDESAFSNNNLKSQQNLNQENNVKPNNNFGGNGIGDTIALGGLSRLNRLKKGTNTTDLTNEITGLELPTQKQTGSNTGGQPLTLNPSNSNLTLEFNKQENKNSLNTEKTEGRRGQNTHINNDLWNDDEIFGSKNNDFGGKKNLHGDQLTTNNKVQAGGRDRSHLTEKKNEEFLFNDAKKDLTTNKNSGFDSDDLFGKPQIKKETNTNKNSGFDPDELFGNPQIRSTGNKNSNLTGMALAGIGMTGNNSLGGNFGSNETNNTQRKREVKNTDFDDNDLFGSNTIKNTTNNNKGYGMGGLGDLGIGKEQPKFNNINSSTNDQDTKGEPKRMRMNDLSKKTDNKDKEKNLAKQAANGGGFFDEFEL